MSPEHAARAQAVKRDHDVLAEPRSGDHDMPYGEKEKREKKRPSAGFRAQGETTDAPSHSTMNLDDAGDRLELRITDDGCGFDVKNIELSKDRGIGLTNMRERVERNGSQGDRDYR